VDVGCSGMGAGIGNGPRAQGGSTAVIGGFATAVSSIAIAGGWLNVSAGKDAYALGSSTITVGAGGMLRFYSGALNRMGGRLSCIADQYVTLQSAIRLTLSLSPEKTLKLNGQTYPA